MVEKEERRKWKERILAKENAVFAQQQAVVNELRPPKKPGAARRQKPASVQDMLQAFRKGNKAAPKF